MYYQVLFHDNPAKNVHSNKEHLVIIFCLFYHFYMSDVSVSSEIIGKKVFFVYPTGSVQQQIVTELVQQEFEVYTAKDHSRLAQALKKYPDSVLFINIDEGMAVQNWESWVKSILSALPEIKIGVFSNNTDEESRNKHITDLHVTCGYITSKVDMSRHVKDVLNTLNDINVKGRRKYLRSTIIKENAATINMPHDDVFIKGDIRDISTVGISCSFNIDPGLRKNTLYKNVQIRLQGMLLKVEAVVFGSRSENGTNIYVMLFTQRVDPGVRVKIRKYIQQDLQSKMDGEIN
jgi:hypothetical protein